MPPRSAPSSLCSASKPGDDVVHRERRHVRAHRQDAVRAAIPHLGERMVVVLVEARARIRDHHQLARPRARVVEQLAHELDVFRGRRGDDQLVDVAHLLARCGIDFGRAAFELAHGGADDLHHVEEHAVVQARRHLGCENTVLERGQARLHQTRPHLAEQQQRVFALSTLRPPRLHTTIRICQFA